MTIYILVVLIAVAFVAALAIRPRGTGRWALFVGAPIVVAVALIVVFRGLRPIRSPTIADVLLVGVVAAGFIYQLRRDPDLRRSIASRLRPR